MSHRPRYRRRQPSDYVHYSSLSSSSQSIRPPSYSIRPPAQSIRPQSIRPKPEKRRRTKKKARKKIRIRIFLPDQQYMRLRVDPTAFIKDIKKQIENKIDIDTNRQQLFFQGEELNDDWTLIQSNFPTAIFLSILKAKIQIYVKTLSGKTVKMNANETDTIQIIKERIQNEEGINAKHQQLIFSGKELEDHHDLIYYQIISGSTLYSTLRFRSCNAENHNIRIEIRTTTNDTIAVLFVHRNTFIHDIKAMIEQKTNVFFQLEDDLIFSEQILENTLRLSDYNIYNNSILYLQCLYEDQCAVVSSPSLSSSSSPNFVLGQIPEMQESFDIYIEIPEMYHGVIQLEVESNDTIETIKEKIEVKEIIPVQDQMLTHFHKLLEDSQTLCHYNIDCESVLQLKFCGFSKFLMDKLQ